MTASTTVRLLARDPVTSVNEAELISDSQHQPSVTTLRRVSERPSLPALLPSIRNCSHHLLPTDTDPVKTPTSQRLTPRQEHGIPQLTLPLPGLALLSLFQLHG